MNARRFTRPLLCLVLVFCMVSGILLMPVRAEEEQTSFHYVSMGASNTNGYGMRGYITEDELALLLSGQVSKDEVNVYGYQRTPEGAYPDLIRDYYAGIYNNVTVDQLAISSMRVEELRVLLDESYMGDDYTSWRFTGDDGWFKSAEEGGIDALRAAYQESVTNADLITVDIGWNNFGVYVCNQLVDYMSNGSYKWTTDIDSIYDTDEERAAAAEAKAIIGHYIQGFVGEGAFTDALTDIFAYSILGYIHNFDIVMEKIYELNPDADVVVIGIQNLLHGVVVEINGQTMPLGDIFGNFVNMANYYASACSPWQNRYQYVKAGNDEHVTIFLDFMKSYDGDAENLNQNVKDCFDYYDNDLFLQTRVDYMAAELVKQMVAAELGEDNLDLALQVLECETWLDVVAKGKAGELPTNLMGTNYQEVFDSKYWPALYAAYDTLAQVVKVVANLPTVNANDLLGGSLSIGEMENQLKNALEAEVQENAIAAANGEGYTVDTEKILPDSNAEIVAAMYIRYYMGNSFFAHPNEDGHAEIRDAVIGVITNPESEKDQALADYLSDSVKEIHQLLCGAKGHEQIFTTTTDATCDQDGLTVTSCACGTETTETVIEKTGHSYVAGEPVWAEDYSSCTITVACENCGDGQDITDDTIDSQVTREATCKADGEAVYTADFSEYTDVELEPVTVTVVIPMLVHDYEEVVTPPTCTEEGYTTYTCAGCGNAYMDDFVDALGHDMILVDTVPATCDEDGHEYYVCSRGCGEEITEVLEATGHSYVDGTCENCGEEDPEANPSEPSEPSEPSKPSRPGYCGILDKIKDWFGSCKPNPEAPSEPVAPSEPEAPSEPSVPSKPVKPGFGDIWHWFFGWFW